MENFEELVKREALDTIKKYLAEGLCNEYQLQKGLEYACYHNKPKLFDVLIEHINKVSNLMCLRFAIMAKNQSMVAQLLEKGMDPSSVQVNGFNLAWVRGSKDVLSELLNHCQKNPALYKELFNQLLQAKDPWPNSNNNLSDVKNVLQSHLMPMNQLKELLDTIMNTYEKNKVNQTVLRLFENLLSHWYQLDTLMQTANRTTDRKTILKSL